jgi:hypothetical protein
MGIQDEKRGWHLEKTVSVGHLITTFTVACSVVIWAMSMDTRVTVLEKEMTHAQAADAHLESQLKESVTRIEAAVIRIETVLREKADK